MSHYYTVSDDSGWSVLVPLDERDVQAIITKDATPQVIQICKDKVEREVRKGLALAYGEPYAYNLEFDPDSLTYDPR